MATATPIRSGQTSDQSAPRESGSGAVTATGNVWGCYLHGLFANESLRRAWLTSLGWHGDPEQASAALHVQAVLDTVASHVEASLDMGRLETIIWGRSPQF